MGKRLRRAKDYGGLVMTPRSTKAHVGSSTLFFFVRHGLTPTTGAVLPGRAAGLSLSEEGRAQAEATAARLAQVGKVAAVYASPLERARQTAAPIARSLGLKPKIDKGLLECDFGEWTGAELRKLMKLPEWKTVQRWPSGFRFPGGESFCEMQARITGTIHRLAAAHRGQSVVLVSHADPIKAAVADALGTPLDLFQRIVISPCSITSVSYGPTGPAVLGVNAVGGIGGVKVS